MELCANLLYPDPVGKMNADPCLSGSTALLKRHSLAVGFFNKKKYTYYVAHANQTYSEQ